MNKPDSTASSAITIQSPSSGRGKPKDALHKVSTGIHRAIFKASKGRIFGKAFGMPVAELVTTGRRSGKERSTMLAVPITESDHLVLVASFGGDDRHPAWYLNLRANPEERAELWPRITSVFDGYARYQGRTERPIPVVILEPR
jgi:hypothetical protein